MTYVNPGYARIYVSDYATYNNGSLNGRWITINDKSVEEIQQQVSEILKENELLANGDWTCEEPMIQDFENFPEAFYSECMIHDAALKHLVEYLALGEHEQKQVQARLLNYTDTGAALQFYEQVTFHEDLDEVVENYFADRVHPDYFWMIDYAKVENVLRCEASFVDMPDGSVAELW